MSEIVQLAVEDVEKRRIPSKHYVYMIVVTRADGTVNVIFRRYSKFFELQCRILDRFPVEAGKYDPTERILPFLPGKILIGRSHIRTVALKRLQPIDSYCKELLKLKNVLECPEVQEFVSVTKEDVEPVDSENRVKKRDSSPEFVGKEISGPVLNEQYIVIATYTEDGPQEVSLRVGEIIDVIEKYENGWWFVSAEEGQGWAPSSYIERADGQQEDTSTPVTDPEGDAYIATKDYEPEFADEVRLNTGVPVAVIEKNLNGWWVVRSGKKKGKAPATYLTKTDTVRAKNILSVTSKYTEDSRNFPQTARKIRKTSPVETEFAQKLVGSNDHHSLIAMSPPLVKKSIHVSPQVPNHPGGLSSQIFTEHHDMLKQSLQIQSNIKLQVKRVDKINGVVKQMHPPVSLGFAGQASGPKLLPVLPVESRWHIGEVDADGYYQNVRPPPRRRSVTTEMDTKIPEEAEQIYVCVSDFIGQAPGTIDVQEGQQVQVLDKNVSGWTFVQCENKEGWAPSDIIMRKNRLTKKLSPARPPLPTKLSPGLASKQTHTKPSSSQHPSQIPKTSVGQSGMNSELARMISARKENISEPSPGNSRLPTPNLAGPVNVESSKSDRVATKSPKPVWKKETSGTTTARWTGPLDAVRSLEESSDSEQEYANEDEVHEARGKFANFGPTPAAATGKPKLPSKKPALPSKPKIPIPPKKQTNPEGRAVNVKAMMDRFQ